MADMIIDVICTTNKVADEMRRQKLKEIGDFVGAERIEEFENGDVSGIRIKKLGQVLDLRPVTCEGIAWVHSEVRNSGL